MKEQEQFKVRDQRHTKWFWSNSEILTTRINYSVKLVYLGLCVFANNQTQECFPRIETLESISGVSRRSVFYALNQLERCRLISRISSRGRTRSNHYTLLDIKGANLALIEKRAKTRIKKVQINDLKGANKAPLTILEEQSKEQNVLSILENMRTKYGKQRHAS